MQSYALSESNYITSMQGIGAIKNNNRQEDFRKANAIIYGNYQEKIFQLGKINVHLGLLAGIAGVLFLIGILSYSAYQVYFLMMTLGDLMAVLGIAGSLLPAVANLALITIPINEAKIAFNRMFEFASVRKEKEGITSLEQIDRIEVRNLSFRFAGRKQLLKGIDLNINRNELIAITGESGSGKSTLGQIFQKFYAFESGSVTINDHVSLIDIKLEDWRKLIGVVPQEVVVFPGNVIDNILLGTEGDPNDVMIFCKEYGFEDYIVNFPNGYNTLLGEGGINLSGGQKQIIAWIRALYQKPALLILDEGTSAMDRQTEKFALQLLNKLKKRMSIIFISHRLHSLKDLADKIYVLENGLISAKGNHEELMKSKNFYSNFWKELNLRTTVTT